MTTTKVDQEFQKHHKGVLDTLKEEMPLLFVDIKKALSHRPKPGTTPVGMYNLGIGYNPQPDPKAIPTLPGIDNGVEQKEITSFNNWGFTVYRYEIFIFIFYIFRTPSRIFVPKIKEHVLQILRAAVLERKTNPKLKLRVAGHRHSWSDVFIDAGDWFIDMAEFEVGNIQRADLTSMNEKSWRDHWMAVDFSPKTSTGELREFFLKFNCCIQSDVILESV